LLGQRYGSAIVESQEASNGNERRRCIIDVNGTNEISLLSFKRQRTERALRVHRKKASKQAPFPTAWAPQPHPSAQNASNIPYFHIP
jgi:hypothetical protein